MIYNYTKQYKTLLPKAPWIDDLQPYTDLKNMYMYFLSFVRFPTVILLYTTCITMVMLKITKSRSIQSWA